MAEDTNMPDSASTEKDSDWVRVTSTDGYSFVVRKKVANVSGTMRTMLDTGGNYAEALTRTCPVHQRGIIVEKLVQYMLFKSHYEGLSSREEIPVNDFMERIPPEIVLELLLAADYQEM